MHIAFNVAQAKTELTEMKTKQKDNDGKESMNNREDVIQHLGHCNSNIFHLSPCCHGDKNRMQGCEYVPAI